MADPLINEKSYNFPADIIRVIAIFGVLAIHTANTVYARIDYVGGMSWWVANLIDSFSRASIPLFIMLSGYFVLSKNESFSKTLLRVTYKIFIPLVFWTAFYVFWNSVGTHRPFLAILQIIFSSVIAGGGYHLYFLGILVGLYLLSPVFRILLRSTTRFNQIILISFFLCISFSATLYQYFFLKECIPNTIITLWIPYAGFFLIGYILGALDGKHNKIYVSIYFISLVSTAVLNYYHYYLLIYGGQTVASLNNCTTYYSDSYTSINVITMSISAFAFLIYYPFKWIKSIFIQKFIYSFARASFGIYLVHLFLIQIIENNFHFTIEQTGMPLIPFVFAKWLTILVLSYIITFIGMKTPVVKIVFGVK